MKAKEVAEELENGKYKTVEEKLDKLFQLYKEELLRKIKLRYPNVNLESLRINRDSLVSLRREMEEWFLATKRLGKYDWLNSEGGGLIFEELMNKKLTRRSESRIYGQYDSEIRRREEIVKDLYAKYGDTVTIEIRHADRMVVVIRESRIAESVSY